MTGFSQSPTNPRPRPERLSRAAADLSTSASKERNNRHLLALPGRVELAHHPLRRRGWSFVGPTTVYAFMQAMGMVNDHMVGCWRRQPATEGRGGSRPALA